jgi:hypothetical protein
MDWLMWAGVGLFAFVMLLHNPILPIWFVSRLPVKEKAKIYRCFLDAWARNLLTIIPDLLAPIVVPVALLFTKWEDDNLPRVFRWWDNDVTINGDRGLGWEDGKPVVPLEDTPEARALAFYVDGKHHPRSFYARWVWLGLRNRASMLSMMLGEKDAYKGPKEVLWSEGTNYLWKVHDRYRLNTLIKLAGSLYIRLHYGFKVGHVGGHGGPIAIGFTLRGKRD